MEINVGDYVRGFRGINKVMKIEPYNESYFYYTDGKNNNEGKPFYFERHITKHSKDIMDLIECQDLLYIDISPDNCGGIVVPRIAETQEELNKIISNIKNGVWILKEIVTKEQIKSNAYTIEKER